MDTAEKAVTQAEVQRQRKGKSRISRREFLKAGAAIALSTWPLVTRSLAMLWKAHAAIQAREEPHQLSPKFRQKEYELTHDQRSALYNKYIKSFVDPIDGQPIVTSDLGVDEVWWFTQDMSILYNQQNRKEKGLFSDFVDQNLGQAINLCKEVELPPCVYLEAMSINSIITGGLAAQKQDVHESKFQVVFSTLVDILGKESGSEVAKLLQFHLSNPYSPIFNKETKKELLGIAKRFGLATGDSFGKNIKPSALFEVLRLYNPTLGILDFELSAYAEAIDFIKERYPQVYRKYFARYPDATTVLLNLRQEKRKLDDARKTLKQAVETFLTANPNLLDEFFDEKQGSKLLESIGIGEPSFGFTSDALEAIVWENRNFGEVAEAIAVGNPTISEEEYFRQRRETIIENTRNYYQELYLKDPLFAKKTLLADQVFNNKFQDYLRRRGKDYLPFGGALNNFNSTAYGVRMARFRAYEPVARLEYDTNFQVALSVALYRRLLDYVVTTLPECNGEVRNRIYWQTYLVNLLSEIAPLKLLTGSYLRPDVDDPYNHIDVLTKFRDVYYRAYWESGSVTAGSFPNDFKSFTIAENKSWEPARYGELPQEQIEVISKGHNVIHGRGTYSSFWWAKKLGQRLGFVKSKY